MAPVYVVFCKRIGVVDAKGPRAVSVLGGIMIVFVMDGTVYGLIARLKGNTV